MVSIQSTQYLSISGIIRIFQVLRGYLSLSSFNRLPEYLSDYPAN